MYMGDIIVSVRVPSLSFLPRNTWKDDQPTTDEVGLGDYMLRQKTSCRAVLRKRVVHKLLLCSYPSGQKKLAVNGIDVSF